jgi:hypothetical protein
MFYVYCVSGMKHAEHLVVSETRCVFGRRRRRPREQFGGRSVDAKTRATHCLREGNPSASMKGGSTRTSLRIYLDANVTRVFTLQAKLWTSFNFTGLSLITRTHKIFALPREVTVTQQANSAEHMLVLISTNSAHTWIWIQQSFCRHS